MIDDSVRPRSSSIPLAAGEALPPFHEAHCAWHSEQRDGDRLLLRLGRQGAFYAAQDTRYGTLLASADGRSHRFDARDDADPVLVEKFVASLVPSLVRQLQGKLSLHGSVVCMGESAVAFIGSAFAGKSTFAHACVHFSGAALLADDTVAFAPFGDGAWVEPMQRGTWLLAESREFFGLQPRDDRKLLLEVPRATSPKRLQMIVLLTDSDRPHAELERVEGYNAFRLLAAHVFRFAHDDPSLQRRELDMLANLAPHVGVFLLKRRRDFSTLESQVALVREAVRALGRA